MFPATLAIDDPGVADELAFPTVSFYKTGDDPSAKQTDISAEYSKLITEDLAFSVAPTWSRIYSPGGPTMTGASGLQNLETTLKYESIQTPNMSSSFRSASISNGAAVGRRTSAPSASPSIRRLCISAKASAICRSAGRALSP